MSSESQSLEQLNREIERVRHAIFELGPIHPGSVSSQYHACGNPSCRCHDPEDPKKHGPYTKLTYSHGGKSRCRFVRQECLSELQRRLANYKEVRELVDKWIALSIQAGAAEFFSKRDDAAGRNSKSKS